MFGFTIVWLGQIISVLASSMTGFGLSLWMYKQTESAFKMGLMQVAYITPFLLLSPIAGAMVDRYNRKLMMMVSDHRPLQRLLLAGRRGTWGRHGPADSFHLPGRCPGGTDRLFYPAHPQRRNDPAGSRPTGEGR